MEIQEMLDALADIEEQLKQWSKDEAINDVDKEKCRIARFYVRYVLAEVKEIG